MSEKSQAQEPVEVVDTTSEPAPEAVSNEYAPLGQRTVSV